MKKLFLILFCIPILVFSQEEKRLALVIGNANYDKGELKNPVNDALLIAETLKKLDFEVILDTNITDKVSFIKKIREFGKKREEYDHAFVYYAGHGIQIGSENYLLPIKCDDCETKYYNSEDDIIDYGVSVQKIMRYLTGMTNQVNILILDACRDNPYESNWNKTRSLGKGSGLAKIPPPAGSLIAFSTDAGNTAADGNGKNSIYCESLSKNLLKPNTEIKTVFQNVRADVLLKTNNEQSPVENSKLTGDLYLIIKKDYNKIEVKNLLSEAEKEKDDGNIEESINKYTILELYLKGNMQNIDKNKLIKVYLDMGQLYWDMKDNHYEEKIRLNQWDEAAYNEYNTYQIKSSNSFLNAKLLLETEGIIQEYKDIYSEAFYKYLRVQSYLDYANRELNDSTYIENIILLKKFNEDNFGKNDYRTACSYYLAGLFYQDDDPIQAYNILRESSDIFSGAKYIKQDLIDYALTHNVDYMTYKWSIMAFNNIMDYAIDQNTGEIDPEMSLQVIDVLKEYIADNLDSVYDINMHIINRGIEMSKSNNYEDVIGILSTATTFCDHFPLLLSEVDQIESTEYVDMILSSINYENKMINHNNTVEDSIKSNVNNARRYNNIRVNIDSLEKDSIKHVYKKIYDLEKLAFNQSIRSKNSVYILFAAERYLKSYYFVPKFLYEPNFYNPDDLKEICYKINNVYNNIMAQYRISEDPGLLDFYLDRYIKWMDYLIIYEDILDKDIIMNYTDQKISRVMNDKSQGFGHYNMIEAYNYKANRLIDFDDFDAAKPVYIDILNNIDNNKSDWVLSEDDEGFKDINEVTLVKYSYAFNNYMLTITNEFQKDYSENDSIMISKFDNFIKNNKDDLLKYNLYYILKIKLLEAKTFYYWYDKEARDDILNYCDDAISILDKINNNENLRSGLGFDIMSQFQIEDKTYEFIGYKLTHLVNIDKSNDPNYIKFNNELIKIANNWKEKEKIFPIMTAYENIVWHYFNNANYKKYKSASLKSFEIGQNYLTKDDFSYFASPKDAKLALLMETGRFLVHSTELVCNPSNEDRKNCIKYHKLIENYIMENYDSVLVSSDSYGFDNLRKIYTILSDQYYYTEDYNKAIEYFIKDLDLIKNINDSIYAKKEEIAVISHLVSVSEETDNDSLSLYYYTDYINKIKILDTIINISCSIVNKDFTNCEIPFVCLKINTKHDVWPCIEFDIDKDKTISNLDKRYYISKDNLVVEKITKIDKDIGGYYYQGINEDGVPHDTTSVIFFEKNNVINTSSYFIRSKSNQEDKPVQWEFYIPLNEIYQTDIVDGELEFNAIINYISDAPGGFTLSRRYNKDTYPLKAKFTGFKDTYRIQLKD